MGKTEHVSGEILVCLEMHIYWPGVFDDLSASLSKFYNAIPVVSPHTY